VREGGDRHFFRARQPHHKNSYPSDLIPVSWKSAILALAAAFAITVAVQIGVFLISAPALSEYPYNLRHPPADWHTRYRPPLIERNPVAFWQCISGLLLLALLVALGLG